MTRSNAMAAEHYSIVTNNGHTNQHHSSTIFVNKTTYLRGKEGKVSTSIPRAEEAAINIPKKQATDEQINLQKKGISRQAGISSNMQTGRTKTACKVRENVHQPDCVGEKRRE
jgi:hypothetical protein